MLKRIAIAIAIVALVVVNLAIASPAAARWDNATCSDEQGEQVPCCESGCLLFCSCFLET